MPSVKLTATKMSDAKVSFISLVERGANRIPFKIVKQENQSMAGAFKGLDLGSLFTTAKAEKPQCEVVGVVTMKGEGFDSVVAQIGEAGFSVDSETAMEDGSVLLKQVDKAEGQGDLIRMGEHALLITKGFRPYSMDISSDDVTFADMVKAQGFYPGISTAMDVVRTIILNTAEKSDDPVAASKAVGKVMDEFKSYVQSLIGGLPSKAFKLESVFPEEAEVAKEDGEVTAAVVTEPAEAPVVEGAEADPVVKEEPVVVTEPTTEGEPTQETAVKSEAPVATGLTEEQVSAIFASKLESTFAAMAKKMDDALAGIQQSVTENVATLSDRVEKAEANSEAAAKVLAGTLVGGSEAEDHAPVVKAEAVKSNNREIDTAFMGTRPRSKRR